jgi:Subtilase family
MNQQKGVKSEIEPAASDVNDESGPRPPPMLLQNDLCGGLVPPLVTALELEPPPVLYVEFKPSIQPENLRLLEDANSPRDNKQETTSLGKFLHDQGLMSAVQSFESSLHENPDRARFYTLRFNWTSQTDTVVRELNKRPEVVAAIVARKLKPASTTSNPLSEPLVGRPFSVIPDPDLDLDTQWYLFRCGIDRAWRQKGNPSGRGVVIADIDWGFRTDHFDLEAKIKFTHNSMDGSSNVSASVAACHGTAVVGLAAAENNEYGMVGVAFGSDIWAIMAGSDPYETTDPMPWCAAIDFVRSHDSNGHPKVIMVEAQTLPGENIEVIPHVREVIRNAISDGITVCVAGGNGSIDAGKDAQGNPFPPTGSIVVGATTYDAIENPTGDFSNFGDRITIFAPGDPERDLTCSSYSTYGYRNRFGGTSGATAKVGGTVALMLEVNPNLKPADIADILRQTGKPIGSGSPNDRFLDADQAVSEARNRS